MKLPALHAKNLRSVPELNKGIQTSRIMKEKLSNLKRTYGKTS